MFQIDLIDICPYQIGTTLPALISYKGKNVLQYPGLLSLNEATVFKNRAPAINPHLPKCEGDPLEVRFVRSDDYKALEKWRTSNDRRLFDKAITILENRNLTAKQIADKCERSVGVIKSWIATFNHYGIAGLNPQRKKRSIGERGIAVDLRQKRLLEILHDRPKAFGINRTSWSLLALTIAYRKKYNEKISLSSTSRMVQKAGFSIKKARRVLTSPDPEYREKVEQVLNTLQNLKNNELFFFIDELGPLRVKKYGGRMLAAKNDVPTFPQVQVHKGSITMASALNATTNQVSWLFSPAKDTQSMVDLVEILFNQHPAVGRIYLTWNAASWHSSVALIEWLDSFNAQTSEVGRGPIIQHGIRSAAVLVGKESLAATTKAVVDDLLEFLRQIGVTIVRPDDTPVVDICGQLGSLAQWIVSTNRSLQQLVTDSLGVLIPRAGEAAEVVTKDSLGNIGIRPDLVPAVLVLSDGKEAPLKRKQAVRLLEIYGSLSAALADVSSAPSADWKRRLAPGATTEVLRKLGIWEKTTQSLGDSQMEQIACENPVVRNIVRYRRERNRWREIEAICSNARNGRVFPSFSQIKNIQGSLHAGSPSIAEAIKERAMLDHRIVGLFGSVASALQTFAEASNDDTLRKDLRHATTARDFIPGVSAIEDCDHGHLLILVAAGEPDPAICRRFLMGKAQISLLKNTITSRYRTLFTWLEDFKRTSVTRGFAEYRGKRKYLAGLQSSDVDKRNKAIRSAVRWLVGY
jgi:transposase